MCELPTIRIRVRTAQKPPTGRIAPKNRERGFAIVESMIGACVLVIGFLGIWMAAGQCLAIARAHRETIAATECLLQRAEESRAVGWSNLTTATGIQNYIFNNPPASAAVLAQAQETITVSIYPPVTPTPTPIVVRRNTDGSVQIVSQPASPSPMTLRSTLAVRVDFEVDWQSGSNSRQRVREYSTVVALEGLLH